jgi:hypothetical protein
VIALTRENGPSPAGCNAVPGHASDNEQLRILPSRFLLAFLPHKVPGKWKRKICVFFFSPPHKMNRKGADDGGRKKKSDKKKDPPPKKSKADGPGAPRSGQPPPSLDKRKGGAVPSPHPPSRLLPPLPFTHCFVLACTGRPEGRYRGVPGTSPPLLSDKLLACAAKHVCGARACRTHRPSRLLCLAAGRARLQSPCWYLLLRV